MVGRTVSQHAVPMAFGVKLAAWLNLVVEVELEARAREVLSVLIQAALLSSLRCPQTGTSWARNPPPGLRAGLEQQGGIGKR